MPPNPPGGQQQRGRPSKTRVDPSRPMKRGDEPEIDQGSKRDRLDQRSDIATKPKPSQAWPKTPFQRQCGSLRHSGFLTDRVGWGSTSSGHQPGLRSTHSEARTRETPSRSVRHAPRPKRHSHSQPGILEGKLALTQGRLGWPGELGRVAGFAGLVGLESGLGVSVPIPRRELPVSRTEHRATTWTPRAIRFVARNSPPADRCSPATRPTSTAQSTTRNDGPIDPSRGKRRRRREEPRNLPRETRSQTPRKRHLELPAEPAHLGEPRNPEELPRRSRKTIQSTHEVRETDRCRSESSRPPEKTTSSECYSDQDRASHHKSAARRMSQATKSNSTLTSNE